MIDSLELVGWKGSLWYDALLRVEWDRLLDWILCMLLFCVCASSLNNATFLFSYSKVENGGTIISTSASKYYFILFFTLTCLGVWSFWSSWASPAASWWHWALQRFWLCAGEFYSYLIDEVNSQCFIIIYSWIKLQLLLGYDATQ
jgi:hypothetical protein